MRKKGRLGQSEFSKKYGSVCNLTRLLMLSGKMASYECRAIGKFPKS